jgi:acyl-coenzyme A synthetase/AMP-(fatty) acid ligase
MDQDGYLYIVARESDMIKSGGHRINPQEIEEVVAALPEVAQCAVVGVEDPLLDEAIAAFVVLANGKTIDVRTIMHRCHQHLPRFKLPHHVLFVADLPRTETGKLQRQKLKQWFLEKNQP